MKWFRNGAWSQSGQVMFPAIHVMQSVLRDMHGSSLLRTSAVPNDLSLHDTIDTTNKVIHAYIAIDIV